MVMHRKEEVNLDEKLKREYGGTDKEWEIHLRSLSSISRDSNYDSASDPALLNSVKRLYEICKSGNSEVLIARVYPNLNKIFQRSVSSVSQSQASNCLLLLVILQFYLDFGDVVLHDADPSLRTFFRTCLSREFADPVVAEATLEFVVLNKKKLIKVFPMLLPQFFPLFLKLIAWNGEKFGNLFLKVFDGFFAPGSFVPLFTSLLDLPILVVAMEKVERSSGTLVGNSIASIQKSAAPEMLLALMDEAYTGSTIGDGGVDSEFDDSAPIAVVDPLFLDLLKDENDGLSERHWASPVLATTLQAVISAPLSNRLREALKLAPRLLKSYFSLAFNEANDSLICALIPLVMTRYSALFPEKVFLYEVQKRLVEFVLAAFHQSPHFVALLKKPIVDRLGEAHESSSKNELALHLCWAIGEYGGGGGSYKDTARELFESLELLLYENLSSSRLGLPETSQGSGNSRSIKSSQSRLLCFVLTAIAKLATRYRELQPRARVSLAKVARSRTSDAMACRRAQDYLGLMSEPAIALSILGPSSPSVDTKQQPGTIRWGEGHEKMIAHIPFYILGGQEGPPFHEFSFLDVFPTE